MTFGDALAVFVSRYSVSRAAVGETMSIYEIFGGLIGVLAGAVEQLDEKDRAKAVQAIHEALDDRMADPTGEIGKAGLN